jgi:hypothetical protein
MTVTCNKVVVSETCNQRLLACRVVETEIVEVEVERASVRK